MITSRRWIDTTAGLRGTTLVELSIGVVVIGLLLLTIVGSDQFIASVRAKRLIREVDEYRFAYLTYVQRYDALPGDDPRAAARWPSALNGNGDWVISGNYDDAPPADGVPLSITPSYGESLNFWSHLRLAGLVTDGAGNGAIQPVNVLGGVAGVQQSGYGLRAPLICLDQVPPHVAAMLDRALDDGDARSGTVRANTDPYQPLQRTYHHQDGDYVSCVSLGGAAPGSPQSLFNHQPDSAEPHFNAHGRNPNARRGNPNARGGKP